VTVGAMGVNASAWISSRSFGIRSIGRLSQSACTPSRLPEFADC
jgi:hypothetical protein